MVTAPARRTCNSHPSKLASAADAADGEGMGRKRNITIRVETPKGRIPEAIQYRALASMSRTDDVRTKNRRDRKDAKQQLRKGDW